MRGFLGGVSIGTLVAVCGAAMWSLSTPLPSQVRVSVTEPDAGVAPEPSTAAPIESPGTDADLVEAAPVAPRTAPVDDVSGINAADTQTASRPELALPGEVAGSGESALPDQPAAPSEPTSASGTGEPVALPETLTGEDDVVVSTQPAPAPSGSEADVAEAPTEAAEETDRPQIAVGQDRTPAGAPSVPAISMPSLGTAPAPTAPPVISFEAPAPEGQTAPSEQDAEREQPDTGTGPLDDGGSDRIAGLPTADAPDRADGPQIGTRVRPLTERDGAEEAAANREVPQLAPFEAFAAPFDGSDGRPLMSIVLIDDANAVGAEALAEFPYPLSFAIDPEDPRAAEKMAAHRAAGFEVLILADLPREAQPQDAETALAVWRDRLPEAVAFLEGVKTGVQGTRPLADQVSDVAQAGGYGLLLQNSGLNTVQKLALREGIPAGVVFRDFDGAGQNPRAMRRFLDQAAFRAGQEGAVIMLGRLQPDTISALLLWGLQDRASRVALAPVSASLAANLRDSAE